MNVLEMNPTASASGKRSRPPGARLALAAALLIFAFGTFVRLLPTAKFTAFGPDEALYRDVIVKLDRVGLGHYPEICQLHIEDQRNPKSQAVLPPTRFFSAGMAYFKPRNTPRTLTAMTWSNTSTG